MGILRFMLLGALCASWTWMSVFFLRLGKFSAITFSSKFSLKKNYLFIWRDRERERENTWGIGREKGREKILSRLHVISTKPKVEVDLMNQEIMTWTEIKSRLLNQLSHPRASQVNFLSPSLSSLSWILIMQMLLCLIMSQNSLNLFSFLLFFFLFDV